MRRDLGCIALGLITAAVIWMHLADLVVERQRGVTVQLTGRLP